MLAYYRYRSLYNGAELKRMEEESSLNGVKVSQLQNQMDSALDKISDFLQNQLDGDTIRRMAMEKVDKEEKEAIAACPRAPMPGMSRQVKSLGQRGTVMREGTVAGVASRQSTQTKALAAH